ncbi:MAG TPA: C4-type zinc ribbon domain-containing protein [Acidimicrobiales bacterium]|nr:C4-type zinc ribbon domain-containing protein [Acidimicrobiales bacterium]
MTVFERLLEVQDHDTAVDRLRHQRARLAERAELAALQKRRAGIQAAVAGTAARLAAVEQHQETAESEATLIGQRIREIEKRMYSGEVSATRDLLAMTAEIETLKVRCSALEDVALAAMEEAEPLAEHIAALEAEDAALAGQGDGLVSSIAVVEAEIDAEVSAEEESRRQCASQVPADLLETYERLRSTLGGIGAARLVGTSCSGCHLTLPASEVARLKREPPDALVLCEQCGRILVR